MDNPNFFSVLPAAVRYCKQINHFDRILYSEAMALSNKWGYCNASNGYFAELYDVEPETVSRAFSKLSKAGHIKIELSGSGMNERKIYPLVGALPMTNISWGHDKNVIAPHDENVNDNNIHSNNKSIVGKPDDAAILTDLVKGAINLLNDLTNSAFKPTSKKTRDTIKARMNEGYTLPDFEKVIRHKVASWLHDAKQSQYLRPETLFGPKFEGYLQCANRASQINDIAGLIDIELTDDQANLYLEYYQHIRDKFPRLFATTKIIPASEYFSLRPGGKRHKGLSLNFSPGDLRSLFTRTHEQAATLVESGKHCPAILDLLNQNLSKR